MCGTIVYWCDTNIMPVSLSSYSSNPKDNFLCHDCIFFNVYKKAMQRPSFQKTLQNYCFFTNNRCSISEKKME